MLLALAISNGLLAIEGASDNAKERVVSLSLAIVIIVQD